MSWPASAIPALGGVRFPGATYGFDFANNYYQVGTNRVGGLTSISGISVSRSSVGYAADTSGLLTSFASGVARRTNKGLLIEDARTNIVVRCRHLTNASWVKTSTTAALDQIGADGVASSASSLTATGANGTCLQTTSVSSSARAQSAFVKRLVGTGTIEMTMDNGATWTAIVPTSSWVQYAIPTQTLANPVVGFRIATSGDSIAVDFVQNENGTTASSPILTTGTTATRAADDITITGVTLAYPLTMVTGFNRSTDNGAVANIVRIDDGVSSANNCSVIQVDASDQAELFVRMSFSTQADITIAGAMAVGTSYKIAARVASNDAQICRSGTLGTQDTTVGSLATPTVIRIGSRAAEYAFGYIERLVFYPVAYSDALLQSVTS